MRGRHAGFWSHLQHSRGRNAREMNHEDPQGWVQFLGDLCGSNTFFPWERRPSSDTGHEVAARATFSRKRAKGCDFYRLPCHSLMILGTSPAGVGSFDAYVACKPSRYEGYRNVTWSSDLMRWLPTRFDSA